MKKFTVFTSVFALLVSVSFAQQNATSTTVTSTSTLSSDPEAVNTTGVRRVITTQDGTSTTIIRPKTTTTTIIPKRVVVREALETFFALGLRTSLDYHFSPQEADLSCLWLFGEIYGDYWGIELGIGSVTEPISGYTNAVGTASSGSGEVDYLFIDTMAKWYLWFTPRVFWLGLGFDYMRVNSGRLVSNVNSDVTYTDSAADDRFYVQFGMGLRFALALERLHFVPDVRYLFPIDTNTTGILRVNLGITYDFAL